LARRDARQSPPHRLLKGAAPAQVERQIKALAHTGKVLLQLQCGLAQQREFGVGRCDGGPSGNARLVGKPNAQQVFGLCHQQQLAYGAGEADLVHDGGAETRLCNREVARRKHAVEWSG